MRSLFQLGWSMCCNCGSFSVTPNRLCTSCERRYQDRATPETLYEDEWPTRFLFDWREEDESLSRLIQALKGARRNPAWAYWAEQFAFHHRPRLEAHRYVFVGAPRKDERPDHSEWFAYELARLFQARYVGRPVLKRADHKSVLLLRKQRLDPRRFVKNTSFQRSAGSTIVLMDDVRTTGATARAVFEALGRPKRFEHWVLAYRPPKVAADFAL